MAIDIKTFFDEQSATFTHIVTERVTRKTAIIDAVLDYDQYSGKSGTQSADKIIAYVKENQLVTQWVLDTHIHADHITASHYLKEKLGGKIGIGKKIKEILSLWLPIFNTAHDTDKFGSQFDVLFEDQEIFYLGETPIKVLYTPGHTPACVSYLIEDNIFVGDTIFMPDFGTARTDFPGGCASAMYDSIKKILSLPDDTKIFMCHDYPPQGRDIAWVTTVKEQREKNVMIHDGVSKEEYITARQKRDEGKPVPKMLLPAIQANMRAGRFGHPESNGIEYIKIPVDKLP